MYICKLNILDYVSFRSCTKLLRNVDHLTLDVPFSRSLMLISFNFTLYFYPIFGLFK